MTGEIDWDFFEFCIKVLKLQEGDVLTKKHWEAYEEYKNGK